MEVTGKEKPVLPKEVKLDIPKTNGVLTKPKPPEVDPLRSIILTKKPGEKWSAKFEGQISRRDINRLRTALIIFFNRERRKGKILRKAVEVKHIGKLAVLPVLPVVTKEQVNG